MKFYFTVGFVILFCSCVSGQKSKIIEDGAKVEKLAGDFSFTEGPASDTEGNVYFTDQPNDRILIWSIDEKLITWMQPSGRSNGLCFDKDGNLWSCADEKNALWIIDKGKNVTVVRNSFNREKLNGPNDVWVAPDGTVFFTDPFYKRSWWDHDAAQQDAQGVYSLSPDHQMLDRVIDDLKQPNGIIGTPDGKKIYIADIGDNKTYCYTIEDNGTLNYGKLFCEMGSDGMTIDERGNVYLTNAAGVTVFNPKGEQIENIKIDEPWTANVCFGGKDMKSLFITAKSGLYRIKMNVKGVGSQ